MNHYRPTDYRTPRTTNEAFGEPWCVQVYHRPLPVWKLLAAFFAVVALIGFAAGVCNV